MQNASLLNNHQYLNRLALTTGNNEVIDPYSIIKDFFHFGNLAEMKNFFKEACRAALAEKYSWEQGSPGNLLYFYERLEKLVEACFIIFSSKKHKTKLSKKILNNPNLPCSLSADEIQDPFSVIQSFFELQTIKKWKQDLYAWMEAGLSNYTVLDSIEASDILPYHYHLQKLLDASWYISLRHKNKRKRKKKI
ncbi:MAG: hypothetical protein NVSMB7_01530 [Chitinophagaceae bacterium]